MTYSKKDFLKDIKEIKNEFKDKKVIIIPPELYNWIEGNIPLARRYGIEKIFDKGLQHLALYNLIIFKDSFDECKIKIPLEDRKGDLKSEKIATIMAKALMECSTADALIIKESAQEFFDKRKHLLNVS